MAKLLDKFCGAYGLEQKSIFWQKVETFCIRLVSQLLTI